MVRYEVSLKSASSRAKCQQDHQQRIWHGKPGVPEDKNASIQAQSSNIQFTSKYSKQKPKSNEITYTLQYHPILCKQIKTAFLFPPSTSSSLGPAHPRLPICSVLTQFTNRTQRQKHNNFLYTTNNFLFTACCPHHNNSFTMSCRYED